MAEAVLTVDAEGEKEEGSRAQYNLLWHDSRGMLLSPTHLLKFLEPPKLVSAVGDQTFNARAFWWDTTIVYNI